MIDEARSTGTWTESALKVMQERYLAHLPEGRQETPEDMFWRVAQAVAQAELRFGADEEVSRRNREFYDLMIAGRFLPNSPTLMNAGRNNTLQYSACYVLPVEDSLNGIFEAIKRAALIHQSGGGTGFAFSRLRPRNATVASTGGKASGPVSFLRVFNAATEAVKQGGTRRGANMGILRVDHPDILEFIDCKLDGSVNNFNLSVAVTDTFMQAVRDDNPYDLIEPRTGQRVGALQGREVFARIVHAAWRTGDPGLVFIDRVNAGPANPTPSLGQIEATNPCGEEPLFPNEACNLGSLNLGAFVRDEAIEWEALDAAVRTGVRFLDDVIEVNPYPLPEIQQMVDANRRIGLGVMGWADLLLSLRIPYDSEAALDLADRVMSRINRVAHEASEGLARERGPFPNWSASIYRDGPPLRNSALTTVAPTGSISIIAGCSAGIEPLFAVAFSHIVGDRHLTFVNPRFEKVARERGFYSPELMQEVGRQGTVHGLAAVPEDVRRVWLTAHEIRPEWHVRVQAAFQRHTDNGVSKTINMTHSASVEDVAQAYTMAYDLGCLGITVYRDGSKSTQVLYAGTAPGNGAAYSHIQPRPRQVAGVTYRTETPLGTAFVTVNQGTDGEPLEVFANVGKAGSDTAAVSEAIGRLISLCLRLPSPLSARERLEEVIGQMAGIGGGRQMGFGSSRVRSLPDGVAQVLAEYLGVLAEKNGHDVPSRPGDLCPECGHATLVYEEGCQKCYTCGYSMC